MLADEITRTILDTLMRGGRTTWTDLSQRLGLSAPAVAGGFGTLRTQERYEGTPRWSIHRRLAAALPPSCRSRWQPHPTRVEFLDLVARLDEVQECHHIAGEHDYVLKVRCAGTEDLDRVVKR